jgi:hypothetical protein
VTSAYIRAQESYTMRGLHDGTYYLYFTKGSNWNGNKFTADASYRRFDDPLPFTTTSTTYSIWRVTLHGVAGGTASARNVDEDAFPGVGQ